MGRRSKLSIERIDIPEHVHLVMKSRLTDIILFHERYMSIETLSHNLEKLAYSCYIQGLCDGAQIGHKVNPPSFGRRPKRKGGEGG